MHSETSQIPSLAGGLSQNSLPRPFRRRPTARACCSGFTISAEWQCGVSKSVWGSCEPSSWAAFVTGGEGLHCFRSCGGWDTYQFSKSLYVLFSTSVDTVSLCAVPHCSQDCWGTPLVCISSSQQKHAAGQWKVHLKPGVIYEASYLNKSSDSGFHNWMITLIPYWWSWLCTPPTRPCCA